MTDKPSKRKRKSPGPQPEGGALFLRQRSDPRSERRYEARPALAALLTVIAGSLAAVALGAGAYGQWFRAEDAGSHPYAMVLLGAGALVAIAVAIFGQWGSRPIRVGDAGVAVEKGPGEIDRVAWRDVTGVALSGNVLTFRASGAALAIGIPVGAHPQAAARALAEAHARIPARVEGIKDDALPRPDDAAGQVVPLEAPQVAGLHCAASEKLIAFERDARLCGRCGEVYHKDGVPRRCVTCDAPLKA